MNEIVSKSFLARDKFMSEIHLRQPKYTSNVFGHLLKNQKVMKNFKETGNSRYILKIQNMIQIKVDLLK